MERWSMWECRAIEDRPSRDHGEASYECGVEAQIMRAEVYATGLRWLRYILWTFTGGQCPNLREAGRPAQQVSVGSTPWEGRPTVSASIGANRATNLGVKRLYR
jgi:hypothetical protein